MHLTYEFLPTRLSERRSKGLAMEFSAAKRTTCLNSVAETTLKQCHEPRIYANAIHITGIDYHRKKTSPCGTLIAPPGSSDAKTPVPPPVHP